MTAPAESPEVNYWMFGGERAWLTETQIEIVPDDYQNTIETGDIAFLRVPGEDGRDQLVGWGECLPTTGSDGRGSVVLSRRTWPSPLTLDDAPELWSLSYFRDPDHMVHGLSAREASILLSLVGSVDGLPPSPSVDGRRGMIDEILLAATEMLPGRLLGGDAASKQSFSKIAIDEPDTLGTPEIAAAFRELGQTFSEEYAVAREFGAGRFPSPGAEYSPGDPAIPWADRGRRFLWEPGARSTMPRLDDEARDLVAFADALARRLPEQSAATDSHVAVALLAAAVPVANAADRAVAERIVPVITADLPPDRAGDWWVAVGLPPKSSAIAAIAPDSTEGVDQLNRTPDIMSFANAIASRAMSPPLSIGVFGEWGAGKTFFMRKLRDEIDRINANVKQMPDNEPIGYCERIAQVEFNAWHYAETQLWPSLIHHMLANLAVGQGDDKDVLTELLLDELAEATENVEAKKKAVDAAEADVREAEWKACVAQKRLEVAERRAGEVTSKDVWAEVADDPEIRAKVGELGKRFGRSPIGAGAIDLYHAVDDTIDLVTGGLNVLRLNDDDASVPTHWRKTVVAMIAIVVLAGAGAFILDRFADLPVVAGAVVALGPLGSLLAGVARWLDVQNRRGREVVTDLTAARDRLQHQHEEKVHKQQVDAAAARQRVGMLVARQAEASAELVVAEAKRGEAENALKEVTPEERLAEFVRSRTSAYRSHLGLVTAVRHDFEKLGGLLADVRTAADVRRKPRDGDEPEPKPEDGAPEIAEQPQKKGLSIDRIVVYIDDLDRCKPETVVKVLEAVHLLLAFEFIVVVVGVDARWVGRSLLKTYPDMLGAGIVSSDNHMTQAGDPAPDPGAEPVAETDPVAEPIDGPDLEQDDAAAQRSPRELLQRPASEHDYIEKIFQVPYWLEPLNTTTVGQLVRSVVGPVTLFGAEPVAQTAVIQREADDTASQPFVVSDEGKAAIAQLHSRLDKSIGFNPNPAGLTITDRELLFMDVVYPLVSRSPRSAKRFVNLYRVIKAGLGEDDLLTWVASGDAATPCHAVILLLAIVCGTPQSSTFVLGELADLDDEDGWERVSAAIGREMTPDRADERRRWIDTQQRYSESSWTEVGAAAVKPWLGTVARYSFRSGHLDLVRPLAVTTARPGQESP